MAVTLTLSHEGSKNKKYEDASSKNLNSGQTNLARQVMKALHLLFLYTKYPNKNIKGKFRLSYHLKLSHKKTTYECKTAYLVKASYSNSSVANEVDEKM